MLAVGILISALGSTAVAQAPPRSLLPSFISKLVPDKPQISSSFSSDQPPGPAIPVVPAPPLPDAPMLDAGASGYAGLTEESTEIVSGLVESFFNRQKLQEGEAECLSKGAGDLAGDVTAMAANLFVMLNRAMGHPRSHHQRYAQGGEDSQINDGAGGISDMVDGMMAGGDETPGGAAGVEVDAVREKQDKAKVQEAQKDLDFFYGGRRLAINSQLMSMAPGLVMQMGMAGEKVVAVSHQVVKECLHQDALDSLKKSAKHMHQLQYISGHLVANGQDIVEELADAVTAYKAHNFRKFGNDFGKAARKVFLCNETGQGGLPEGRPDPAVVSNITEGLMKGFFGEGSMLDLKLPGDIDREPAIIPIDLHQCIADNMNFFQSVWAELMWVYAKRASGVSQKDEMQWSTAVAFTMMGMPKALEKCSMGPEEQQMLEEAIMGLANGNEGLRWDFKMPENARVSNDRMERHMAITVKDWAEQRWETFGEDLGKLLQEMALTMLEKEKGVLQRKYSLDSGILRKSPLAGHNSPPLATYLGLALAGAAGVGLTALRRIGASARRERGDISDCTDEEAVE